MTKKTLSIPTIYVQSYHICFWVFFILSVRSTGGNDPLQGGFPILKCQKPRVDGKFTGCNGTLVDAYEQSNYSKSDKNINRPDTFMFLYTRRNKICPEFLHRCDGRLPNNTNFRPGKRIIFIVGGYISGVCDLAFFRELKDQFLFRDDYNVILVDWPWGYYPDIYSSFVNAEVVGKQIAFVIIRIMEQTGVNENDFYIIGHSIGAHIAGHAGRYFTLFSGGKKIGRTTGLDPAGAMYSAAGDDGRLDKSDASHVDIIYTNAGKCFPFTIAMDDPTGHANFYVNGGTYQLSCLPNILHSFLKLDLLRGFASLYFPFCSHFQSVDYYKASINPCGCEFIGVECDSKEYKAGGCRSCGENGTRCAVMGLDWDLYPHKNESTVYYVRTKISCPYCDNKSVDSQGFEYSEQKTNSCFVPNTNPSAEMCGKDY